jgi:hypothetical protein
MDDKEVRKDIIIMYEIFRKAYFDGEYDERMDIVLDKYNIKIDSDGYVEKEED